MDIESEEDNDDTMELGLELVIGEGMERDLIKKKIPLNLRGLLYMDLATKAGRVPLVLEAEMDPG